MNGSTSPDPPTIEAGDSGRDEITVAAVSHHRSASAAEETGQKGTQSSPPRPRRDGPTAALAADGARPRTGHHILNGGDDGGDSEAETLINSPVKKKEAERQAHLVKMERPLRHRIGSLPVPTDYDDENDSPVPSTSVSVEKMSNNSTKHETDDRRDDNSDGDDDSDSLSSAHSRESSLERAESERPGSSHTGAHFPNPRKRKHRASSVSLPNKRPSLDVTKRRLRGLHSEELTGKTDGSLSPNLRSHRRAASTQSVAIDGAGDLARKRRNNAQGPIKEPKVQKTAWESDASSETTSHGQGDFRRAPRGVGRSTSTPGRPAGREHKRHVNKYGFTRLAEACEANDLEQVKVWRDKDPDQLELAEFAGNKPLQIAAVHGNVEVVDYLIDQGCQIDCANLDKDTPLIDAAENGHLDVVKSLLRAGVDPLRQNLKGQQALDAVTDETEAADEIRAALREAIDEWNSNGAKQRREEEEELRHRVGPTKEVQFMARTHENLLKLVQINDRNGVREFLDARVMVDNTIIAAAAKTGDSYLVNMLLVELPEKKRLSKPEKPLLSVLGTSHFEMVKSLTELDNFNPLYRNRSGKTWPDIAEERRGPNWRQERELLQTLYDTSAITKERRSSSPVTKRDSGKRRFISRAAEDESEDDEEEEEEAPRRKNGRKLMSKREMRVARGKATSDGTSDESDSEMANGPEAIEDTMKPPESPATKRTPTRSRTKSFSAQPPEPVPSPKTRRCSSSLRASSEQVLPTVEESEDKIADMKEREAEASRAAAAAEEARILQHQREEEARAQAEAAAQLAAEEEARKAEEARREEERLKAEEQQKRKAEEEEMAKRLHRKQIFSSLPATVSYVLDEGSSFDYQDPTAPAHLMRYFAPLQVFKYDARNQIAPNTFAKATEDIFWIVNIQAAPLLGTRGLELMLRSDVPGFAGSLADMWETKDVNNDDLAIVASVIAGLPQSPPLSYDDGHVPLTWAEELQRAADRANATANAKDRLRNGDAVLRYVRLDDVLNNLHTALRGIRIDVRFDHLRFQGKPFGPKERNDFVARLSILLDRPVPRTYVDGANVSGGTTPATDTTSVTIVHEK